LQETFNFREMGKHNQQEGVQKEKNIVNLLQKSSEVNVNVGTSSMVQGQNVVGGQAIDSLSLNEGNDEMFKRFRTSSQTRNTEFQKLMRETYQLQQCLKDCAMSSSPNKNTIDDAEIGGEYEDGDDDYDDEEDDKEIVSGEESDFAEENIDAVEEEEDAGDFMGSCDEENEDEDLDVEQLDETDVVHPTKQKESRRSVAWSQYSLRARFNRFLSYSKTGEILGEKDRSLALVHAHHFLNHKNVTGSPSKALLKKNYKINTGPHYTAY